MQSANRSVLMGWRSGQTPSFWSAVVPTPSRRCRDCRANRDKEPVQDPAALAGSEPRGQQAIVDLPCHGEAVKRRGGGGKTRRLPDRLPGRGERSPPRLSHTPPLLIKPYCL